MMFEFPNAKLKTGIATESVKAIGLQTLHEVAHWVWRLPYGRTQDRANYLLIPKEQKGACSGKHALIAKVAEETEVPLFLTVGIFMMNQENTPGIKSILSDAGLESIPEAHCFLTFNNLKYDFTSYQHGNFPIPKMKFLAEERISPAQIGAYKIQIHRRWVERWAVETKQPLTLDELWNIRETCIEALA